MELYVLDPLLRRNSIVEKHESLIWTERFLANGDFELTIYFTVSNRSLLKTGTLLSMNESYRVMVVETVEDNVASDGKKLLSVKGRSLEIFMMDRVAKESLNDLTTSPTWTITDQPADVARKIFHDICVTGILDPADVIPFINEGTFLTVSTIPEPVDPITVDLEPQTVYDAISNICTVWNLGFRILRHFDLSALYFDIYSGTDRTTSQTVVPAVVFTPELDNLQNTKELTTIDKAKNVAYVFSPAGFEMVYPVGVDPEVEGFDRRVLMVNASDITSDNPDVSAALIQRGLEELANNQTVQSLDGEISQSSQYQYGQDFHLGDIVEMRNTDGVANNMRVTEQIFVSDSQGERSYPTLTLNTYINTGSWLSWLNNKTWFDMDAVVVDQYWEDQP